MSLPHLKEVWLSNRAFTDLDTVTDACCQACDALLAETGRVHSICSENWAKISK